MQPMNSKYRLSRLGGWLMSAALAFTAAGSARARGDASPADAAPQIGVLPVACENRQVTFELGSTTLSQDAREILDGVASCMDSVPELQFWIIGEADEVGASSKNWVLAFRRAKAVTDYLSRQGIDSDRLTPVSSGENDEGGDLYRRVIFDATTDGRLARATEPGR